MAGWLALAGAFAGGQAGNNAEARAALDAADIALDMGRLAREKDIEMFDLGQEFMAPYRQAGLEAMPEYERELYSMDYSPANDYMTREDLRRMKMQAAASGKLRSGTTARSLGDIYERAAVREYNRRYEPVLNAVNAGAGHAFGASQGAAAAGADAGNLYLNAANQLGAITRAQGQSDAAMYGALGQAAGTWAQDYFASREGR